MNAINQVKRLKSAFPNAEPGFYDMVIERAKASGFSDQRLNDAVNNLIDTFRYPQPLVSDVISWDKRLKLHTYTDMTDKANAYGPGIWDQHKPVKLNGSTFWISKSEALHLGVEIENIFPNHL